MSVPGYLEYCDDDCETSSIPHTVAQHVVNKMDNLPHPEKDMETYKKRTTDYYLFYVDGFNEPIGLVHGYVITTMPWTQDWTYDNKTKSLHFSCGSNYTERSRMLKEFLEYASAIAEEEKNNPDFLPLLPIRTLRAKHTHVWSQDGRLVMDMDDAAVTILGVLNYTVSLIVWAVNVDGYRRYWVLQHTAHAQEYPGKSDCIISGRMQTFEAKMSVIKREAYDKTWFPASFPTNRTLDNATLFDSVKYTQMTKFEPYRCRPHYNYVYQLQIDPPPNEDFEPHNEKEGSQWYSPMGAFEKLRKGEFQPHAAMVFLAVLIKHGHVTPVFEPEVENIRKRLHREIKFPNVWTHDTDMSLQS